MELRPLALSLGLLACRPAPAPRRYAVEIKDMAFVPATLTVAVGDTVVWTDRDIVPHTATEDRAGGWEAGPIMGGESGMLVMRTPGTVRYACRFHPEMHGTLEVRAQR